MARKKTGPSPIRQGSFPVGHSCHTTCIPAFPKIWPASFSALDSMSVETCLKLKTRTLKAEATTFGSGFGADIVLTCSVHEFRVLSLATLSCCPKSNFAKNDVATKQ